MTFEIAFERDDHPFGVFVGVEFPRDSTDISAEHRARLVPEERAFAATLRGFRLVQWVAGRLAWRVVAAKLGCSRSPLLAASDSRAPEAPPHLSVSVAHKRAIAIVLAGPRSAGTLGVDVEDDEAAAAAIESLVFDDDERAAFARMNPVDRAAARVLAFSLKESIYKASPPDDQRALKYTDASIRLDAANLSVTLRPPFASLLDIWTERRGSQVFTAVRRSSPPT